jgi:hypothetical protein
VAELNFRRFLAYFEPVELLSGQFLALKISLRWQRPTGLGALIINE